MLSTLGLCCRTGIKDYIGWLAGRYGNPMPESTISPSKGLRILATVINIDCKLIEFKKI
jgi:hypothetical protein